jgi:hypothetical protein
VTSGLITDKKECPTNAFLLEKFSVIFKLETQLIRESQVPNEWI